MGRHLAIVEDDPNVRALLEHCLVADGYEVTALPGGSQLRNVLSGNSIDLVIIDVGLPDVDGLTLTRHIREEFDVGIIILSGRGDLTDRVVGLELGADDYITKPFEPREVLARVRSVLRRGERSAANGALTDRPEAFAFDDWIVDLATQTLRDPKGDAVVLTSGEFKLLEVFVTHANRVLTRDRLMELIYAHDTPAYDRSIDVRIGRLRKKLSADPANPRFIKTVRNGGYMFAAKVARV